MITALAFLLGGMYDTCPSLNMNRYCGSSNIYTSVQESVQCHQAYDLSALKDMGEVGSGSSRPHIYKNGQSYIVKDGIGKNHEFIDTVLAGSFVNFLHMDDSCQRPDTVTYSTQYPKDGYSISTDYCTMLSVLGTSNPLVEKFRSLSDIMRYFRGSRIDLVGKAPNIHESSFNQEGYIDALNNYFKNTNPQSIADYYVDQYISGGGDPNAGNWGFVEKQTSNNKTNKTYKYVLAKVDLGASFKAYKKISGDAPELGSNRYAFSILPHLKNFEEFYNHVTTHGNIVMPGQEYEGGTPWTGQGNHGFYNGMYETGAYGIRMENYVKCEHLKTAIARLADVGKEALIAKFR